MKKLLTVLLLSGSVIAANAAPAATVPAASAKTASAAQTVYVDGKPVSQQIINQAMAQMSKNPMMAQQMQNPQVKQEMLKSIGMQQAILAEGNAQKLDQTKEYQDKINQMKPMIYAQILQEKAGAKPITDAQVKAKYDQMKAAASKQTQYNISHILVKDQKTANDIEAQLKKGANFADLAKKYSIDPGSKANGGDLGWSDGSAFVPEFTAAATKLKKGQYTTTPVKTQFGYHIIKLNDVKTGGANVPPFDQVKGQIKQELQMEQTKAYFDSIATKHQVQVK